MPFGFKGVIHGAATCFYAFIGFDIIATTGEEAKNPRRSIPTSIIASLIIIMVAYTACSSIMTLVVPYYELDDRAGLVQVWGQLGYPVVQWAVSFGAIAALLASMFGSMFPMPRIAYAMAKDGLIFGFFASMNSRGVPACATFWLSLCSAFCALYFSLEVLVEMMSIGTLLAYTLVNACVLILRYQHSRQQRSQPAFIELLNGRENTQKLARPNSQIDIMSPMDEFNQTVESEQEVGYLDILASLMNGKHSTQMEINGVPISNKNPEIVLKLFFASLISVVIFDILVVIAEDLFFNLFMVFLLLLVGTINVMIVTILAKFPQGRTVGFATPGVPITPVLGIAINFYLMLVSPLTMIRFAIWMFLGLITYFKYGIWGSRLEDGGETTPCVPPQTPRENNH